MKKELMQKILGKNIIIKELSVPTVNRELEVTMKILFQMEEFVLWFYNVSRLSIQDASYPMQIEYLDIVCNKEFGWDPKSHYLVNDFEEGRFRFFCEDYGVFTEETK